MRIGSVLPLVVAALALAAAEARSQQSTVVIRCDGSQFGFPDEDDPSRVVAVFQGGVEIVQGSRRLFGETLVAVLRRSGGASPGDVRPGETIVPSERVLELFLDGDASIEEGDERVVGARSVHVDNVAGTLTVLDGELHASLQDSPLIIRYRVMRQLADGVREMEGVSYTTCEYAHAHWSMDTPWTRLVPTQDGRILHTGGNTVRVGGLPVFWLPSIHLNVDRDRPPLRRLEIATSRRFGTEIRTAWGGDASELLTDVGELIGADGPVRGEWEFVFDNYTRRGQFISPGWSYETDNSAGEFFGAYIKDRAKFDDLDVPIGDSTRGRFDLKHRTRLDEHRIVDAELSYLSDPNFLKEYYERESRIGKQQETYINYRDTEENRALSILARPQLNHFDAQVEYLPHVEQRIVGERVDAEWLGDPVFRSRSFVSNASLDTREVEPEVDFPHATQNVRVGTEGQLEWPVDAGDDKLLVKVGYNLTGFERSLGNPDDPADPLEERTIDEEGVVRYALLGGVQWARTYSGTADIQSDTWNLDGVRQIVEPVAGFESVLELNHGPEALLAIDEEEKLDKGQRFFVGVRHRMQTQRQDEVATTLDTEVRVPFFPNEDRDNGGQTSGLITVDSVWRPGADIWGLRASAIRWRSRIDPATWQYVRSFLSYSSAFGPGKRFSISNDRVAHTTDFLTLGMEWVLTPRWSLAVFAQQDLSENEKSRQGILLRQRAHRWLIDIELSHRRGESEMTAGDDKNDTQISVHFRPTFAEPDETLLSTLGTIR